MDRSVRTGILVIGALVVAAALVVGLGMDWLFPKPQPAPPLPSPEPVVETKPADAVKTNELTKEDEEFLQWFLDNPPQKPEEVAGEQPQPVSEPPRRQQGINRFMDMIGGGMPGGGQNAEWRNIWANLNLTEEEQTRLRLGFQKIMERWMTMPEEERLAERARLEEMGRRFQAMSEEEKTAASQRMKNRFEDWRQSGSEDLPELSLD